jgi:hypothetical protein
MKTIHVLAIATTMLAACRKDNLSFPNPKNPPANTQPEMIYTDLQNRELKFRQSQLIDLDKDGTNDIIFATWYVGDPVEHEDEILFFAGSYTHSNLLIHGDNQSTAFKQGDIISVNNYNGHNWYQVAQAELALKNTGEHKPPYWEGSWKQVSHKYLAVQVVKQDRRYNGWIEISFDTVAEKLVLHKAAICKEAEKSIIAGK